QELASCRARGGRNRASRRRGRVPGTAADAEARCDDRETGQAGSEGLPHVLARLQLHRHRRRPSPLRHGDRRRPHGAVLPRAAAPRLAPRHRPRAGAAQHRAARHRVPLVPLGVALALVAGCGGGRPPLVVGAVEDAAKFAPDPGRQMQLAADSGFRAIVLSAVWKPGATADADLPPLRRAVRAAKAAGIRPLLAVYQFSPATPLQASDRSAFAAYAAGLARALPAVRDVIVGNEPNLNLFWMPQFAA